MVCKFCSDLYSCNECSWLIILSLLLFENAERVNGMGKGCSNKGVGLSIQSPIKQMENMGQERVVGSDEAMSLLYLRMQNVSTGWGKDV